MKDSPARILVADDSETNRALLSDLLHALGHTPVLVENGLCAVAEMRKEAPDLVLLDIMMPEMDGYEVLGCLKADALLCHIPVIMITAVDDMKSVERCIKNGADDYLGKPFNPILLKARLGACLAKKRLHDQEEMYKRQIEEHNLGVEERVREQVREISAMQLATIFAMAKLVECRNPESSEHLVKMPGYCESLCRELRGFARHARVVDEAFIKDISAASPLHDIGKVGIPDRILQKPGKLTAEEFSVMETHTIIGADTLREVHSSHSHNGFLRTGIDIAESHHERWDGTGYPNGLKGEQIPLPARIVKLADVYDALRSRRCYKERLSHSESREIILTGRREDFDPDVVDAFNAAEEDFMELSGR